MNLWKILRKKMWRNSFRNPWKNVQKTPKKKKCLKNSQKKIWKKLWWIFYSIYWRIFWKIDGKRNSWMKFIEEFLKKKTHGIFSAEKQARFYVRIHCTDTQGFIEGILSLVPRICEETSVHVLDTVSQE